jgi:hypothetical protein
MSFPDVEGAVRDHLRAQNVCGGRVYFGVPDGDPTYPLATVQRVGGGGDISEAPLDLALIQIDVWGRKDAAGHTDKAAARAEANAVRTALQEIRGATALTATVTAYGAAVESDLWAPDPSDRGRYVITALVTARSAVPA